MSRDTFCILSHVGTDIDMNGWLVPCCNYEWHDHSVNKWHVTQYREWKQEGLRVLQQELDSGHRSTNCAKCWHHEDRGILSYRQAWNDQYRDLIQQGGYRNQPMTKLLHIEFDNYCNIKCIMCHPANSSSLAAEVHRHSESYQRFFEPLLDKSHWYDQPEWEALRAELLPQVDYIMFTGGEPLISPHVLEFIEQVPDKNKIGLRITTNGTVAPARLLDTFSQFRSVDIGISLEGVGAHNDLLRYGSRWSVLEPNLRSFQSLPNHQWGGINVGHVFTHTSAWALPDLMRYCIRNRINIHVNPLFGQDWLHPRGVPPALRQQFTERMRSVQQELDPDHHPNFQQQIDATIEMITAHDHDAACETRFWEFVDMLDRIRGTDFRSVMQQTIDLD